MGQLSLRWIMVIVSVIEVAVACVVVWYIGYHSTQNTVSGLSQQLRSTTLTYAEMQVYSVLNRPILAALAIESSVSEVANIDDINDVTNSSLIQACTSILRSYSGLTKVAVVTSTGLVAGVAQQNFGAGNNTTTLLFYYASDSVNTNNSLYVWTNNITQPNSTYEQEAQASLYSATTNTTTYIDALPFFYIPSKQDIVNALQPQQVINTSQISAFSDPFNGPCAVPPCTISAGYYNATNQTQYRSAQSYNGQLSWFATSPHEDLVSDGSVEATVLLAHFRGQPATVTPSYKPGTAPMQFYVLTAFSHVSIAQFLATLPHTSDGAVAILTTKSGITLATSDLSADVGGSISNSTNPFFQGLYNYLGDTIYAAGALASHPILISASINGGLYDLQSVILDTGVPGIKWVLSIYTPIGLFTGNLVASNRNTIILSAVVVIVSIFVTFALTVMINRPILRIVKFMEQLAHESGHHYSSDIDGAGKGTMVVDPGLTAPLIDRAASTASQPSASVYSHHASSHNQPSTDMMLSAAPTFMQQRTSSNSSKNRHNRLPLPLPNSKDDEMNKNVGTIAELEESCSSPEISQSSAVINIHDSSVEDRPNTLTIITPHNDHSKDKTRVPVMDSNKLFNTSQSINNRTTDNNHNHTTSHDNVIIPMPAPASIDRRGMTNSTDIPHVSTSISTTPPQIKQRSTSIAHSTTNSSTLQSHSFSNELVELAAQWQQEEINSSKCLLGACISLDMSNSSLWSCREVRMMQRTFGQMLTRLRDSQLDLERANTAKRQFLRFVFHEVRVPLNAVSLGIEHLRTVSGSEAQKQSLQLNDISEVRDTVYLMHEQINIITRILNDVLSLQRIEDGELRLEILPFCIETMLIQTLQAFLPEFAHKQLSVRLQFGEHFVISAFDSNSRKQWIQAVHQARVRSKTNQTQSLTPSATPPTALHTIQQSYTNNDTNDTNTKDSTTPHVLTSKDLRHHCLGDQYRLRQVISNLVSNACKFTPFNGELSLTLNVCDDPIDMDMYNVRITVADSGVGMTEHDQASLFQPYKQFSPGQLQEGKGSGLGLSIAKRLVALHGGNIGLNFSKQNKGTSFYITLNVRKASKDAVFDSKNNTGTTHSINSQSWSASGQQSPAPTNYTMSCNNTSINYNHNHTPQQPVPFNQKRSTSTPLEREPCIPYQSNDIDEQKSNNMYKEASNDTNSQSVIIAVKSDTNDVTDEPDQRVSFNTPPSILAVIPSDTNTIEYNDNTSSLTHSPSIPSNVLQNQSTSPVTSHTNSPIVVPHNIPRSEPPRLRTLVASTNTTDINKQYRILVVEDSPPNRKLLIMMLKSLGYTAVGVENGQEAVDIFTQRSANTIQSDTINWPYDMILMDGYMPVKNGMIATREIRELGYNLPIIAVTGNALAEDQKIFRDAGVDDVLSKPFDKRKLQLIINTTRAKYDKINNNYNNNTYTNNTKKTIN